jgi:hypothetical protein
VFVENSPVHAVLIVLQKSSGRNLMGYQSAFRAIPKPTANERKKEKGKTKNALHGSPIISS